MKKLVIFIVSVLAIGGIALGVLIYNINPILERFKPQITAKLSEIVKTPVQLGELSVQFFPSVGIEVSDVGLAGDNDSASVKTLMLDTSLLGLLGGNLSVSELALEDGDSLKILVEKDFACLVAREGEDESDMFPHPAAGS